MMGTTRPPFRKRFRAFLTELQQDLTSQIDKKNAEIEEAFQNQRRRQQMLALNLSRVSPALGPDLWRVEPGQDGHSRA